MANVDIRVGKKDAAFFAANPTLILKDGQLIFNETTSDLFIGDGTTQLSSLVAINGASYTLTTSEIGSVINAATTATPNDTDLVATAENAGLLKKITWTNVKAFLKTYFDTLYAAALGSNDNYVTDAQLVVIGNTSGANTGDETTATLKTKIDEYLGFACSDEVSNLATGLVTTFRMPYAMTLAGVRISLTTAPTISSVIVDVKQGGTSIFSTLVSIDANELTSTTAATPAVITTTALTDDSLMTIHITQIGSGDTGKGLKLVLIGKKS